MFGAFVALALWLPHYLINVYGVDIKTAGMLAAFFSLPASLFRAYGGHLSDRYGARRVMYWTFLVSVVCTFMLSYPPTDYVVHGIEGPIAFHMEMGLVGLHRRRCSCSASSWRSARRRSSSTSRSTIPTMSARSAGSSA